MCFVLGCGSKETTLPENKESEIWKIKVCSGTTCVDPSLVIYEGHAGPLGPFLVKESVEKYFDPDLVLSPKMVKLIPQMCPWDISCNKTAVDGFFACVAKQRCDIR